MILWFQEIIPHPSQGGLLEIARAYKISKAKIFKGRCEPKHEFPEGLGRERDSHQNPPWERYGYFLEHDIRGTIEF